MFIKKDLRKIPKILEDAIDCSAIDDLHDNNDNHIGDNNDESNKRVKHTEPLKALKLARRKHEFQGSVKILCEPTKSSRYIRKLKHVELLNLYDCNISCLDGIGDVFNLQNTPNLKMINLGRNSLSKIPSEFSKIQSVQHLWLDDCHELAGTFPKALLELTKLESLRMPNCRIDDIDLLLLPTSSSSDANNMVYDPSTSVVRRAHLDGTMNMEEEEEDNVDRDGGIDGAVQEQQGSMPSPNSLMTMQPLMNLKILCLDRNNLTELPSLLGEWVPNLVELYVRHNSIQSVANVKSFPPSIKVIHLSSNQLKNLNGLFLTAASLASSVSPQMTLCELTHLYVNGNQLSELPYGILSGRDFNGNDNNCCCPKLQRFIFSHNPPLKELPADLWDHIKKNQDGGGDKDDDKTKCKIVWEPNPNLVVPF